MSDVAKKIIGLATSVQSTKTKVANESKSDSTEIE